MQRFNFRHATLWKFNDLKSSNNQLKIPDSKKDTTFMLPKIDDPENGQLPELCGKIIKISKR